MKSVVRSIVPVIVGALLSLPFAPDVMDALGVDQDKVTTAVTLVVAALVAALSGVYYSLVRWAETRWPNVGVLLGWIGAPLYARRVGGGRYVVDGRRPRERPLPPASDVERDSD